MRKTLRRILYTVLVIAVLSNAFIHVREVKKSIITEDRMERNETVLCLSLQIIAAILDSEAKILADLYNRINALSEKGIVVKPDFEKLIDGTVIIYNKENIVAGVCIKEDESFYYILTVYHIIRDEEDETSSSKKFIPESNMGLAIKLEMIQQFLEKKVLQQFVPRKDIINITIQLKNHIMVAGEFLFANPDLDLALLRVYKSLGIELEVLELAEICPKMGDEVYVLGHPLGRRYNLSKGIVSKADIDFTYFGIDALTTWGNSGGAVFNSRGKIIGICSQVLVYVLEAKKVETIKITGDD